MGGLKKSGQPVGAQALTDLTGFAPPNLIDQAVRLPIPQRFVNLVVTNVPGPQFELDDGRPRLLDIFPLVPLANNMNLGIAIVSYNGTIDFGLVGDYDALHDLDDLGEMFAEALTRAGRGGRRRACTPTTGESEPTRSRRARTAARPSARRSSARYEPAPEYDDRRETIVMERPVFPEEPTSRSRRSWSSRSPSAAPRPRPGPEIEIAEPWEGYAPHEGGGDPPTACGRDARPSPAWSRSTSARTRGASRSSRRPSARSAGSRDAQLGERACRGRARPPASGASSVDESARRGAPPRPAGRAAHCSKPLMLPADVTGRARRSAAGWGRSEAGAEAPAREPSTARAAGRSGRAGADAQATSAAACANRREVRGRHSPPRREPPLRRTNAYTSAWTARRRATGSVTESGAELDQRPSDAASGRRSGTARTIETAR